MKIRKKEEERKKGMERMKYLNHEYFGEIRNDPNWKRFNFLVKAARVAQKKADRESNQTKRREEKKRHQWGLKYFSAIIVPKEEEASPIKQENEKIKRKRQSKEEGEEEKEDLKLKRNKKDQPVCSNPPPFLPENMQQRIIEKGGSNLTLVIQKQLFISDVNPQASRFSIPFSQIQSNGFLTETETADLEHKKSINVRLIEPSTKETILSFNRWNMQKTSMYVLTTQWNSVVQDNQLKVDDVVQLWSFRVESTLCFVLVKLPTNRQE